jgi:hypothetical protein
LAAAAAALTAHGVGRGGYRSHHGGAEAPASALLVAAFIAAIAIPALSLAGLMLLLAVDSRAGRPAAVSRR